MNYEIALKSLRDLETSLDIAWRIAPDKNVSDMLKMSLTGCKGLIRYVEDSAMGESAMIDGARNRIMHQYPGM